MKLGFRKLFIRVNSGKLNFIAFIVNVLFVKFSIFVKKSIKLFPRIRFYKYGLSVEWMFLKTGILFKG